MKKIIVALCGLMLLASCGKKETAVDDIQNQVILDAAVVAKLDQHIDRVSKQLPSEKGESGTFIKIERKDNQLRQVYERKDKTSKDVTEDDLKKTKDMASKVLCSIEDSKKFLDAGVEVVYEYHFSDKVVKEITVTVADCVSAKTK